MKHITESQILKHACMLQDEEYKIFKVVMCICIKYNKR